VFEVEYGAAFGGTKDCCGGATAPW